MILAVEGDSAEDDLCSGSRLRYMVGVGLWHFAAVVGLCDDGFVLLPLCLCCLMTVVGMGIVCEMVVGMECSNWVIVPNLKCM